MPTPYRNDAVAPAATAPPMLAPAVVPLARTTTPAKPTSSDTTRVRPIFSPKNRKPTSAVNNTVIALAIAPMPAGARSAPQANSMNGTAELVAPISASLGHNVSGNCARLRHRNGSSTSEPNASRTSTSASGPKSFAAMRMNRNDAPQMAPSTPSSSGVTSVSGSAEVRAAAGTEFIGISSGSYVEHDIAGRATGFDRLVGLGDRGERQAQRDVVLQGAGREPEGQLAHRRVALAFGQVVDDEEGHFDVFEDRRHEWHGDLRFPASIDGDAPATRDRAEVLRDVRGEVDLDD